MQSLNGDLGQNLWKVSRAGKWKNKTGTVLMPRVTSLDMVTEYVSILRLSYCMHWTHCSVWEEELVTVVVSIHGNEFL